MTASADFEAALSAAGYDVQLTTFDGGHHDPPTELGLEVFREVLSL
jgi:S-formylglutathione hydrolase FrmB